LKPPAATTGTSTLSITCGSSSDVGTLPVWPPPSPPCAMITSAPSCTAFSAWRGAPTVGMHRLPAALKRSMNAGLGERL
jgi:hypothetical protein